MFTEDEAIGILRDYRHIYMNDLQVILGYIQLNEQEKAVQYIRKISLAMDEESKLYRVKDNSMKCVLIKGYTKARENFIEMIIEIADEDNVLFAQSDCIYIERELDKSIRQAVSDGSGRLNMKLGYDGGAFLERLNG